MNILLLVQINDSHNLDNDKVSTLNVSIFCCCFKVNDFRILNKDKLSCCKFQLKSIKPNEKYVLHWKYIYMSNQQQNFMAMGSQTQIYEFKTRQSDLFFDITQEKWRQFIWYDKIEMIDNNERRIPSKGIIIM